jgi:ribose 5-phosphate isomerase B
LVEFKPPLKEGNMPIRKRIFIASDHAGIALKEEIKKAISEWEWEDLGTHTSARADYPDYAKTLGEKVAIHPTNEGVLICGSGIGMSIAANKIPGIRAAVVENPVAARLAKEHNHANVLCLGSRFVAAEYAIEIVRTWLVASFDSDSRHIRRIEKIREIESSSKKGALS